MAKLTVKNVGPIREAEIDVKKHTVFIGPQGTGKSTLAKIIAISSDREAIFKKDPLLNKYNIKSYVKRSSYASFLTDYVFVELKHNMLKNSLTREGDKTLKTLKNLKKESSEVRDSLKFIWKVVKKFNPNTNDNGDNISVDDATLKLFQEVKLKIEQIEDKSNKIQDPITKIVYIPAERTLISILSSSLWSLINSNTSIPEIVTTFASYFENARVKSKVSIPFLNLNYIHKRGMDTLITNTGTSIVLDQSASGYQSIIPLLLVVEHQRRQTQHRFIIEEPELNLYPTAQKHLIYSLIGGLQPDVTYQDAEWVITTHSPYVLTSLNTLMLAYKVAQRSDELRTEVEKMIPARCWINPDEFAAYYVDGGTVESITNLETGLINDSRLDDVSEDFAGEQDVLFDLLRTARVND